MASNRRGGAKLAPWIVAAPRSLPEILQPAPARRDLPNRRHLPVEWAREMQLKLGSRVNPGTSVPKEHNAMNATIDSQKSTSKPLTVVVGLDFSDADGPAFDQAARIAQRAPRSALHLVHVFDAAPSAERARDLAGHLRAHVNEKAPLLGGLAGVTVGVHLRAGKVVHEIAQLASEVGADLIVVGSHRGRRLKEWIVGGTAHKLIGASTCPVLVASPWPKEPAHRNPVIEPPCPDCVRARVESRGSRWWCERHSHRASGAHTYSYEREVPMSSLDSQVFPTGIEY